MVNYVNITVRKTITAFNAMHCLKLIDHVIFKTHNFQNCFMELLFTEWFSESNL